MLIAATALAVACVPAPSDPLAVGELCTPVESECEDEVLLQRDVTGRNQVDWSVQNMGAAATTVEVLALVPSSGEDGVSLADADPDDVVARREYVNLRPEERVEDRFTPQDLGVRDTFRFAVRCNGCEARVDWVFATVPRECFEKDDCIANWQCDTNLGRCVECVANADCSEDQVCDQATGRCDPPDTTAGCATAEGTPGPGLLLLALLLMVFGRRNRRGLSAAVGLALLLIGGPALASPPKAAISIGTGPRFLAGELAGQAQPGVGFGIGQELRWRYVGAGISLGTSYFLTRQQGPPYSRQFQTYSVTLGPRVYLPIRWFELSASGDYRRMGVTNNSLVRTTGTRVSFDAVGGTGGFRIRWQGIELRLEGGAHSLIQMPSTIISADVLVGFTNPG